VCWKLIDAKSNLEQVIVDSFSCLDAPVAESVTNIVKSVPIFFVHHSIGDAMSKGVRRHVTRIPSGSVNLVWVNFSRFSNLVEHIPYSLFGDAI
jgi:hypothetical protein